MSTSTFEYEYIWTHLWLVYTCLFGHTSVVSFGHTSVVLFTQDSASLCTLVYMSLCVCSCIFVHTNQYLYCTKSGLFSLASVLRTQYLSAHVRVCPFARLLVCTSACLHMHLLDLYMRLIVYTYVCLFHM